MKNKKLISMLSVVPLLVSCGGKDELVIPTVDVEKLSINLPTKPSYNDGAIRSDETYDYLDLYEISDFHGAVNYEEHSSGSYIGLPKLASYLNIKRNQNVGGTLVLSTGDMFQGSAESNLTRGYMVNYSMNYMGFDAMALGNHEFDWTTEWIKKNANLSYNGYKIPYLCANLNEVETGKLPEYVAKSTVISRGNYQIGIIGSIGEDLNKSILASCLTGLEFKQEKSIVEQEAEKLRNEGCDVVVWLTHNGVEQIPTVSGVDAIFGGHAHENKKTEKGTVPTCATINYGRGVAHIELKINKSSKEVSAGDYGVDENPSSLPGISEDQNVKSIINQYSSSIDSIKNIELGSTKQDLEASNELKNICVDAMQKAAKKANEELGLDIPEDKIIAAYHNISGGIRANINKGKITYGDVYKPFPFDNEIVLWKVKGSVYKGKCSNRNFASWAIWKNFEKRQDLKDDEYYYLVLSDFMALSENYIKGEFPTLEESELIRTGKIVRDEIAHYIYDLGEVRSKDYAANVDCFKIVMPY